MNKKSGKPKCPCCGSYNLDFGKVSSTDTINLPFEGQKTLRYYPPPQPEKHYFLVKAFACIECGFVGMFLSTKDLENLKK